MIQMESAEMEIQAAEAKKIGTLDKGSFRELVDSYERTHREYDPKKREYTMTTDTVLMNAPVNVFYRRTNNIGEPFEKIPLDVRPKPDTDPEVYHGITLRQLGGVWANVERRCEEENWTDWNGKPLSPETVTLHDVKKYVVMPFTEATRQSFVASLPSTATYQVPRVHLSAPFALPLKELITCFETFVHDFRINSSEAHDKRGGGMTEYTPVWLVGFARNQWALTPYPRDPMQTPMAKAIEVTNNRVLSVTDKKGNYFGRAWPAFESFLALKHRLWYIYTALDGKDHKAVGLISGGATSDIYAVDTLNREKDFPTYLVVECIKHSLKNVTAQEESDRIHVLNTIINITDIDSTPPEEDDKYNTFFNNSFRAHFTTPGTLQAALLLGDGSWQSMLEVMSKGKMSKMRFDFEAGRGWDKMTNDNAIALIKNLPRTITDLKIRYGNFSSQFIRTLGDWIQTSDVKTLFLEDTLVHNFVDDEAIKHFAKALEQNTTLESFQVWRRNHENEHKVWEEDVSIIEALAQNTRVADALFAPLDELYKDDKPNFARITFLHTLFMRLNRSFPKYLTNELSQSTLDWAQSLSGPTRAALFQSQAGSFVKTILNRKFTWTQNLGVIMFDLYIQLSIVVLLCIPNGKNSPNQNKFVKPLLCICLFWISIRELTQICATYAKAYINEASNWVDITQVFLLYWTVTTPSDGEVRNGVHAYAICVSWIALIFVFNNFWFPLATFVTAVVKIITGLIPFLFTTLLLSFMFAHAFRAIYVDEINEEDCNDMVDADTLAGDGWNSCTSLGQSYVKVIELFLTSDWEIKNGPNKELPMLYVFLVGVILLNIIIAVVSNIFTDVQNDAETAFWDNRFAITTETASLMSLLPCKEHLQKRFSDIEECRIDFLDESSRNEMPEDAEDSDAFFHWWFSPSAWGVECPNLGKRLQAFYCYSLLEDIVYPGIVLEKIILGVNRDSALKVGVHHDVALETGVNHDEALVTGTAERKKETKYLLLPTLLRFIVRMLLWFLFTIHCIVIFLTFICGLVSLGFFWPRSMKQWLFHVSTEPDISEVKELSNDNGRLKDELRKDYYKLKREIEDQKSGLNSMKEEQKSGLNSMKEELKTEIKNIREEQSVLSVKPGPILPSSP